MNEEEQLSATPVETGSEAKQGPAPLSDSEALTRVDRSNVGAVLGEHIASRSPALMAIAVACLRDSQLSREALERDLERVSQDRDDARNKYHNEAVQVAVLQTELRFVRGSSKSRRLVLGLGGGLFGVGATLATQAPHWRDGVPGILLVLVGFFLMWIGSSGGSKRDD